MGLSSSKGEDGSGVKSDTKDFVDRSLKEDKIVVFIKPTCPFCARIKKLFGDLGAPICIVDITKRPDTSAIQDYLQYKTGGRTVPRVFINGDCVGGCDQTLKMHELGKLRPRLVEVGVIEP